MQAIDDCSGSRAALAEVCVNERPLTMRERLERWRAKHGKARGTTPASVPVPAVPLGRQTISSSSGSSAGYRRDGRDRRSSNGSGGARHRGVASLVANFEGNAALRPAKGLGNRSSIVPSTDARRSHITMPPGVRARRGGCGGSNSNGSKPPATTAEQVVAPPLPAETQRDSATTDEDGERAQIRKLRAELARAESMVQQLQQERVVAGFVDDLLTGVMVEHEARGAAACFASRGRLATRIVSLESKLQQCGGMDAAQTAAMLKASQDEAMALRMLNDVLTQQMNVLRRKARAFRDRMQGNVDKMTQAHAAETAKWKTMMDDTVAQLQVQMAHGMKEALQRAKALQQQLRKEKHRTAALEAELVALRGGDS